MIILPGAGWELERLPLIVEDGVDTLLSVTFGQLGAVRTQVLLSLADAQRLAAELVIAVDKVEPARWGNA